jgi:hypothetical protein
MPRKKKNIHEIVYKIKHNDIISDEQKKFWIKYWENKLLGWHTPYNPMEIAYKIKELSDVIMAKRSGIKVKENEDE